MVLKRVKARVQVGSASALATGQVLLFEVLPFTMIMACKDGAKRIAILYCMHVSPVQLRCLSYLQRQHQLCLACCKHIVSGSCCTASSCRIHQLWHQLSTKVHKQLTGNQQLQLAVVHSSAATLYNQQHIFAALPVLLQATAILSNTVLLLCALPVRLIACRALLRWPRWST